MTIRRRGIPLLPFSNVSIGQADWLEGLLGNFDLSSYPADGPLPPIPEAPNSTRDRVVELAARENLSIRDLARRVAAGRTSRTVVGTASDVA